MRHVTLCGYILIILGFLFFTASSVFACTTNAECPAGRQCDQSGTCVDVTSSSQNCGTIGNQCPSGFYCFQGLCVVGTVTVCPSWCSKQTTVGCSQTCDGNVSNECATACPPTRWSKKVICCKNTKCTCTQADICLQYPTLAQCITPTPTLSLGTLQARAVVVPTTATQCSDATGLTTYLPVTVGFIPATTPDTQQTGSSYVSWSAPAGQYVVNDIPPAGYYQKFACYHTNTDPTLVNSDTTTLSAGGTVTWDLAYSLGNRWTQAQGGDVSAASNIISYVPDTKLFVLDSTTGFPGVVTYGDTTNFTSGPYATSVSSKNWLAKDTMRTVSYYQLFLRRFGGTPTSYDYEALSAPLAQPAFKADMNAPYYVKGDMTTSGAWSVSTGQKLIVIVDGNLTIGNTITTTGTGFIAFIVSGNITVASSVGTLYSSSSSVVDGVYIADGTFATGDSSVAGHERLVARGTFVAGNFSLTRDLDSLGQNNNVSAQLFIYNPANLITMPDAMRDSPIAWQEAAP